MTTERPDLDLLLHPVRIRIVHAFAGEATRTTAELCDRLPDVPQASLYRHVALLARADVLKVVDQRSVRGATERRYRLNRDRGSIGRDDAAAMTLEDHRRGFVAAMAALVADFGAYLDSANAEPFDDRVGYRQIPVWMSREEQQRLLRGLEKLLAPVLTNRPTPKRRQFMISPITFPIAFSPDRATSSLRNGVHR